ncbi:uncharacterized protein LOC144861697 [Branchiostoma floridae x Branchiostoma japonicum]
MHSPHPCVCDFDTDLCQHTQDTTDDFDWRRNSGRTPTGGTGPTGDHTTGSGHYMYIEASSPRQQGDIARLISPTYLLHRGSQCLLFWTHMYGEFPDCPPTRCVGTLRVSVRAGNTTTEIWSRSGNQGNQWFSVAVSIPVTGSYQVIFESVRGGNNHGDVAIDDVSITQGDCPDVDECVPREGRGSCDQICTNTVGGFSCSCNAGFTLHQDSRTCNDDNECSPNGGRGPCDHACSNTVGSYTCNCNMGHTLNSNGHTCARVQCPALTTPENGGMNGGNSYQDVVQFTCNHGYQLIGDSSRTCQADGTWTGTNVACIVASDITPTSVGTQAISPSAIRLTWTFGGYRNLVDGYLISVRPRGSTNVTTSMAGISDPLSSTVHNLEPYTYYEFWIVASIGAFRSDRSEVVSHRTMAGAK